MKWMKTAQWLLGYLIVYGFLVFGICYADRSTPANVIFILLGVTVGLTSLLGALFTRIRALEKRIDRLGKGDQ